MKIWVAPYTLVPTQPLNAKVDLRERTGTLLKIEWDTGVTGYSDVFSWPEFGDPTIEDLIESLRQQKSAFHPLLLNSLIFNREDGLARKARRSLFSGLEVPESHSLGIQREQGFRVFKIKMESDVWKDIQLYDGERLRLDFNGCLTQARFWRFWHGLDAQIKAQVDLIEDPWSDGGDTSEVITEDVSDAELAMQVLTSDFYCDVKWKNCVVKPARAQWDRILPGGRLIFTHSMDHPIGQAFALWSVSQWQKTPQTLNEVHGVSPSKNYVPNDFHFFWQQHTPRPQPPRGLGIGFDEVLQAQDWVVL